jgi:DNA-binding MarR family transcriptional regulator
VAREGHINAAGGFLRALKESGGPGGQAFETPRLPVKELLLLLEERPRTLREIADELVLQEGVVHKAVGNLTGLDLVSIRPEGEGDVAALTELGREVAEQQRAG